MGIDKLSLILFGRIKKVEGNNKEYEVVEVEGTKHIFWRKVDKEP